MEEEKQKSTNNTVPNMVIRPGKLKIPPTHTHTHTHTHSDSSCSRAEAELLLLSF